MSANEALSKDTQTLVGAIMLDPQFSDDLEVLVNRFISN